PVGPVDVGMPRRTEQRGVACGSAVVAVRTGVLPLVAVGLHLRDAHGDRPACCGDREPAAQQMRGDLEGVRIEQPGQIINVHGSHPVTAPATSNNPALITNPHLITNPALITKLLSEPEEISSGRVKSFRMKTA